MHNSNVYPPMYASIAHFFRSLAFFRKKNLQLLIHLPYPYFRHVFAYAIFFFSVCTLFLSLFFTLLFHFVSHFKAFFCEIPLNFLPKKNCISRCISASSLLKINFLHSSFVVCCSLRLLRELYACLLKTMQSIT